MRVHGKSLRIMSGSENLHRIVPHLRRRRDVGQHSAIRPPKPQLAIGLSIDLVALVVDGAVVAAAEQCEVRESGGAASCPVM